GRMRRRDRARLRCGLWFACPDRPAEQKPASNAPITWRSRALVLARAKRYNLEVIEFRILGPLEVVAADGEPLVLGAPKQRALLALLLLRANHVVSTELLIDALWGERPPRTATTSLHNLVVALRKLLGPNVLVTRAPGYSLVLMPERLDLTRFERLVGEGPGLEPQ